MARVLIIDDAGTLLGYKGILRCAGHEVTTAALGDDGVVAACRDQYDVVLCDQRLPDQPGVEVVRRIHEHCRRTTIVLITAWGTPEVIGEAKCAGATSYAAKPLVGDELLDVVDEALRLSAITCAGDAARTSYSARRWVELVVRGVYLTDDPKTVRLWCRAVGVARGTLQKRCDAVGVTPKNSLDFVRLLRVMIQHTGQPWDLQSWLDIADDRTVGALLQRAGLGTDRPLVPDLERFLSHQQLIHSSDLIARLRSRLPRVLAH